MADQTDQNPLDVLEDLLKDAQSKGGKPSDSTQKKAQEKQQLEAQKAQKAEQLRQALAKQKQLDEEQLAKQREDLVSLTETQAYQIRQQQDEEKLRHAQESQEAGDGFEIVQLDHTKI